MPCHLRLACSGCCRTVPGGPGWSHFLTVLVASHVPQLCQVVPLSVQAPGRPHCGSGRKGRALELTSPLSSCLRQSGQPPLPCSLFGEPTCACVCAVEKEFPSLRCCLIQEGIDFHPLHPSPLNQLSSSCTPEGSSLASSSGHELSTGTGEAVNIRLHAHRRPMRYHYRPQVADGGTQA